MDEILTGIAAASLFKLVAVDRITQPWRYRFIRYLRRHPGAPAEYVEYLMGCALCLPLWAATLTVLLRRTALGRLAVKILIGRMVAYALLRWLNETGVRDWPDNLEWPPKLPEDHGE